MLNFCLDIDLVTIFVGVVVGGVVVEEVFTVWDQAAVVRFTPIVNDCWLIGWLPYLFNFFLSLFKFAFPGKFLQTNRNVRDLPLL